MFVTIIMASRYEQFFREADKDGSGYMSVDELITLLRDKGYKATDDKIRVSRSADIRACCRLAARRRRLLQRAEVPGTATQALFYGVAQSRLNLAQP